MWDAPSRYMYTSLQMNSPFLLLEKEVNGLTELERKLELNLEIGTKWCLKYRVVQAGFPYVDSPS